jgi:integrase/recombinase XerC
LLQNGAEINAIKELLGHAGLAATQIYAHTDIAHLKKIHKLHPKS